LEERSVFLFYTTTRCSARCALYATTFHRRHTQVRHALILTGRQAHSDHASSRGGTKNFWGTSLWRQQRDHAADLLIRQLLQAVQDEKRPTSYVATHLAASLRCLRGKYDLSSLKRMFYSIPHASNSETSMRNGTIFMEFYGGTEDGRMSPCSCQTDRMGLEQLTSSTYYSAVSRTSAALRIVMTRRGCEPGEVRDHS